MMQLALSIRQPWAWAILHAGKDVENRSEPMARSAERLIGQTILLHAGKTVDPDGFDVLERFNVDAPSHFERSFSISELSAAVSSTGGAGAGRDPSSHLCAA